MKPLFVDTSGWCAIYHRGDVNHIPARACWEEISRKVGLIYTTDYVLDETLTLLRVRVGHKPAVEFGQVILASKVVKTVSITRELWQKAWEMFKRCDDKEFSFYRLYQLCCDEGNAAHDGPGFRSPLCSDGFRYPAGNRITAHSPDCPGGLVRSQRSYTSCSRRGSQTLFGDGTFSHTRFVFQSPQQCLVDPPRIFGQPRAEQGKNQYVESGKRLQNPGYTAVRCDL